MISDDNIEAFMQNAPDEVMKLVRDWMHFYKDEVAQKLDKEWCEDCEDFITVDYKVTVRSSIEGPEEGIYYCPTCGKIFEN